MFSIPDAMQSAYQQVAKNCAAPLQKHRGRENHPDKISASLIWPARPRSPSVADLNRPDTPAIRGPHALLGDVTTAVAITAIVEAVVCVIGIAVVVSITVQSVADA